MRFAVPVFPGSNCDTDCLKAVRDVLDQPVDLVWHQEKRLESYDAIILPGGFSYGDYLRTGALARFSPVMEAVQEAAEKGKLILGICNGFQVLLEAGLLPGAMRVNDHLKYRCAIQSLKVENHRLPFTLDYTEGEVIALPIAHGEGNYYCDEETLQQLREQGQIVFRYEGENPNGSVDGIAGIVNERGNVLGLMPHPERAVHQWMGSNDGVRMFTSMLRYWGESHGAA
jgi:phosphoribosylformylglycinamidine synthase